MSLQLNIADTGRAAAYLRRVGHLPRGLGQWPLAAESKGSNVLSGAPISNVFQSLANPRNKPLTYTAVT